MQYILLVIIFFLGILVGIIGNISGIGGGVMIILLLVYGFKIDPLVAAGLSLLTISFSSLVGFIQNFRRGLVNSKMFVMISTMAVCGAIAGTVLADYVPSGTFKGVFGFILIGLGSFSILATRMQTRGGKEEYDTSQVSTGGTSMVSIIAGVVSGFIGIGIGGLVGSYLTAIKRSRPKIAISTIVAATLPVTVVGTVIHFHYTGLVNIIYAFPLVAGAMIGGFAGSWMVARAPQVSLRLFQGYIIIAFGTMSIVLYFIANH